MEFGAKAIRYLSNVTVLVMCKIGCPCIVCFVGSRASICIIPWSVLIGVLAGKQILLMGIGVGAGVGAGVMLHGQYLVIRLLQLS